MIPPIYHFILLTEPCLGVPSKGFQFYHYLCLRSCFETQQAEEIIVWVDTEPTNNEWWDRTKEFVNVQYVDVPDEINGKPILAHALKADLLRVELLVAHGGIYADIDTLFTQPIPDIYDSDKVVLTTGKDDLVRNGFIAAPQDSLFMREWATHKELATSSTWGAFGQLLLPQLVNNSPGLVTIRKLKCFPYELWTESGRSKLFRAFLEGDKAGYFIELCQHQNFDELRRLTHDYLFEYNTTFNYVARQFCEKPDLSQLTLVIPVKLDSPHRLENLNSTVNYLINYLQIEHIIVVECDCSPRLSGTFSSYEEVQYLFVQRKEGAPWTRSRPFNCALPWVETDAVAIWDADIIVPLAQLLVAYRAIVTDHCDYCIPYENFLHVTRELMSEMNRGRVNHGAYKVGAPSVMCAFAMTGGGVGIMRTAYIRHIRGMNELFHGWGFEDDEVILRIQKLGGRVVRVNGNLLHIAHTRTVNSFPDENYELLSKAERQRMYNWDKSAIQAYLGITEEGSYVGKRVPDEPNEDLMQDIRQLSPPPTPPDPLFDQE